MGLPTQAQNIPYTVISDGRMLTRNMDRIGLTQKQVLGLIRKQGVSDPSRVFYLSVTRDRQTHLIKKE